MDKAHPHLRREMSRKKCEVIWRIPDKAAAGDKKANVMLTRGKERDILRPTHIYRRDILRYLRYLSFR